MYIEENLSSLDFNVCCLLSSFDLEVGHLSGVEEFEWISNRREHKVQCQEDHGEMRASVQVRTESDFSDYQIQGVPCARGLGFVDLNFECSTVCPILLGLMGICHKRLGRCARRWNIQIKVNPTQVYDQLGHPVVRLYFKFHFRLIMAF